MCGAIVTHIHKHTQLIAPVPDDAADAASVSPSSRGYFNNAAAGPESDTDRGGGRGGGNNNSGGASSAASGRGGSPSQHPPARGGPYGASGVGGGGGRGKGGSGGGGPKKPLSQPKYRTLQRLLQDLEESDYGGIGAWGEFNTNPRRRVSRSFTSEQQQQAQSLGGFGSGGVRQQPSAQGGLGGAQGQQQASPMQAGGGSEAGYEGAGQGPVDGYWGPSSLQQGKAGAGAGGAQAGAGAQGAGGGIAAAGGGQQSQEGNLPVPFYHELMLLQQQQQQQSAAARGEMDDFPSRIISMASVARVGALVLLATGLSYLAVVPRTAPPQHYNYLFKINLVLVLASMAWPLLLLGLMYNPREVSRPARYRVDPSTGWTLPGLLAC